MPDDAAVCVHCGYDRVHKRRLITHEDGDTGAPEQPSVRPTGLFKPAGITICFFFVLGIAAWGRKELTVVYLCTSIPLLLVTWGIQRSRTARALDEGEVDEEEAGLSDQFFGGMLASDEDRQTRARDRAITSLMLSDKMASKLQSVMFAAIMAALAGLVLAFRVFGNTP